MWLAPGSEWVLAGDGLLHLPPRLRRLARQLARDLVGDRKPGQAGDGLTIVRVPAVDPLLGGAAMLYHHILSGTVIYCPAHQITDWTAERLGTWLAAAARLDRSLACGGDAVLQVRVALVQPDQMPEPLDLVGRVSARDRDAKAWVRDDGQLSDELARWLGALCTAQGSCLPLEAPRDPPGSC
jgi:hypothetical protein